MIKALILDYGNVISLTNTGDIDAALAASVGLPPEVFNNLFTAHRQDFDRGVISGEEMYSRILKEQGYEKEAEDGALLEKLVAIDLEHWSTINTAVSDWALAIQKQGFKLGILSNMPYQFLERYETTIPPFTAADYACFSCRLHLIKPEYAIYRNCLDGLGIRADEAVFFDDCQPNITAARELRIHAFLWTGLEQAQKDWQSCLG